MLDYKCIEFKLLYTFLGWWCGWLAAELELMLTQLSFANLFELSMANEGKRKLLTQTNDPLHTFPRIKIMRTKYCNVIVNVKLCHP